MSFQNAEVRFSVGKQKAESVSFFQSRREEQPRLIDLPTEPSGEPVRRSSIFRSDATNVGITKTPQRRQTPGNGYYVTGETNFKGRFIGDAVAAAVLAASALTAYVWAVPLTAVLVGGGLVAFAVFYVRWIRVGSAKKTDQEPANDHDNRGR